MKDNPASSDVRVKALGDLVLDLDTIARGAIAKAKGEPDAAS
jgi:hypothetical protein